MAAAGFNLQSPTLFAWLGVIPYLTLPAFRTTLSFIASSVPGSGVVFDYGQPREALPFLERLAHDSLAARVQLAGEPFQLFFTPKTIAAELDAFYNIEDLDSNEINARYFTASPMKGRAQLRTHGSAGRILSAWL